MFDPDAASPSDDPDMTSAGEQDENLSAGPVLRNSGPDSELVLSRQQVVSRNPYHAASAREDDPLRSARETVRWYRRRRRRQLWICICLFLATVISTTLVGSSFLPLSKLPGFFDEEVRTEFVESMERIDPSPHGQVRSFRQRYLETLVQGLSYSGPLMLILLCHEMGHFLQAVRHRVPASFPFFIPLPIPPLGTMGAVIAQSRGAADRKQMFDIAVSGPLAGLIVTLPVLYLGTKSSQFGVMLPGLMEFGEPLIIQWMIAWIHGPTPDGQALYMNGVALAGWVGVFVTALNLIPIGQLDGGHLTYTLLGKSAHWIAILVVGAAAAFMILTGTYSYILFLFLIMLMGTKHPPTRDDTVPLGLGRHVIGWLTLAFLLIGFTPTPIVM